MITTHQSAYGLPLSPPDAEFHRFLQMRRDRDYVARVLERARRVRERGKS
jgi:hypothetical protein